MGKSAITLLCVLVLYWFALSGYFDHTVLFVTGGLSVLFVIGLSYRMKILDDETTPYLRFKSIGYFIWLFKEIVKANVAVVRAVLSPDMEISPSMFKVKMGHGTDLGRTTFANSITLTPGTISVEMEEGEIMVHALLDELTDIDGFDEMGGRSGNAVSDPMGFVSKPTKKLKSTKKRKGN